MSGACRDGGGLRGRGGAGRGAAGSVGVRSWMCNGDAAQLEGHAEHGAAGGTQGTAQLEVHAGAWHSWMCPWGHGTAGGTHRAWHGWIMHVGAGHSWRDMGQLDVPMGAWHS